MTDPAANRDRFVGLWKQVAERYRGQPDRVAFELLNEPNGALTADAWNAMSAAAPRSSARRTQRARSCGRACSGRRRRTPRLARRAGQRPERHPQLPHVPADALHPSRRALDGARVPDPRRRLPGSAASTDHAGARAGRAGPLRAEHDRRAARHGGVVAGRAPPAGLHGGVRRRRRRRPGLARPVDADDARRGRAARGPTGTTAARSTRSTARRTSGSRRSRPRSSIELTHLPTSRSAFLRDRARRGGRLRGPRSPIIGLSGGLHRTPGPCRARR